MESEQFDRLTRGLASWIDRRRLLRGLLPAAAAGVLVQRRSDGAVAACPAGTTSCRSGATTTCVSCGPGQVVGSGCRCLCRNTGRPPSASVVCGAGQVACAGCCFSACPGTQVIDPGTCTCGCPVGTVDCGGTCVDANLAGTVAVSVRHVDVNSNILVAGSCYQVRLGDCSGTFVEDGCDAASDGNDDGITVIGNLPPGNNYVLCETTNASQTCTDVAPLPFTLSVCEIGGARVLDANASCNCAAVTADPYCMNYPI